MLTVSNKPSMLSVVVLNVVMLNVVAPNFQHSFECFTKNKFLRLLLVLYYL
jgi:hypothetical protein